MSETVDAGQTTSMIVEPADSRDTPSTESDNARSTDPSYPELTTSTNAEVTESTEEPTLLDYARFHGIARDYTSEKFFAEESLQHHLSKLDLSLQDLSESAEANLSSNFTKERLIFSKDTALFLHSICVTPPLPGFAELPLLTTIREVKAELKQEVPILHSDHELDVLNFGSTALPDLGKLRIPLETVDIERDEGLEWPSKYYGKPQEYFDAAQQEKIKVTLDDLRCLSTAIRDDFVEEDSETIKMASLECQRNPALEPVTPPLLPLTPPMTPYVPSSPDNHIELLSEQTNSTAAELHELDACLMREDAITHSDSTISDPMLLEVHELQKMSSPIRKVTEEKLNSVLRKRRAEELKLEGPLTPQASSPEKRLKSVSFPEMLHEYIPELPSTYENGEDVLGSQDSFNAFFNEEIAPLAEEVNKKLENEKLSEVDTTKRVDVPELDFTLPKAPWLQYGHGSKGKHAADETELDAQMKFLLWIKRNELRSTSPWHGLSVSEKSLPWAPVPLELGKVVVEEELEQDDGFLGQLFEELSIEEIADSSSLVWKPDGLRIFDNLDESEDELEPAEFDEGKDMSSLLRKRILELDEATEPLPRELPAPQPLEIRTNAAAAAAVLSHAAPSPTDGAQGGKATTSTDPDNSLMFGGLFSASTALHKFMNLHGKEAPKETPAPASQEIPKSNVQTARPEESPPRPEPPTAPQPPPPPFLSSQISPYPTPPAATFILSTTLLTARPLFRRIQTLYPTADLIERDFSAPHSPAPEADMMLSPSTGLIHTTLQKIKQLALPGQTARSPVKERIEGLAMRYERLVVLISEGGGSGTCQGDGRRVLDQRDVAALTDLEDFAAGMEAEVEVRYVEGGGEELAGETVVQMGRSGLRHGSADLRDANGEEIKFLQDETLWELFLRRAGLNPFAAQAILALLKTPYSLDPPSITPSETSSLRETETRKQTGVFGLSAFVLMDPEERVRRFQVLCGGPRILGRVSRLVEQRWPCASDRFAGL